MSYYGFFNDSAYQVVDGNIVYASDLNNPMAALETGISGLVDAIQTGATIKTATDTGVVNAYVMSLTAAPAALVDGLEVWLKPAVTNSGAATLNLNSLGAKAIRSTLRTALVGGELLAGYPFLLKYVAASDAWLIVSDPGSTELDTSRTVAAGDGISVATTDDTITIEIEDGGVTTEKIADGGVTRAKMADDMDVVVHNDILGGDITVSANTLTITPCGCWDSTRTVWLESTTDDTVVIPGTNNLDSDVYIVRLVAGSAIDFKSYDHSGTGPSGDATVNAYRQIGFAKNNGSGVTMPFKQIGDRIDWSTANRPVLASSVTTSFVAYAVSDVLPVALISELSFVPFGTGGLYLSASYDGTTAISAVYAQDPSGPACTIISVASVYLKSSTGSVPVHIVSVTLRR